MRPFIILIATLFTALASHAFAVDIPVEYWVDGKVLKKEAPTGTDLTFELHTDPDCISLYHSEVKDITALSFTIETLKLAKVKGALKAPKPARLNTVLTGVTAAATTYLKVSGTGIVPVNGECQLQASGTAGPAGANGLPGADGADGLSCWDLNGNGVFDPNEDIVSDGVANAADCVANSAQDLGSVLSEGNDAGGATVSNLADPTASQDAATKAYVDALEARLALLEGIAPPELDLVDATLTADGRTFFIIDQQMSATEGQQACEALNMNLAKITTAAQSEAVSNYWGFDRPNTLIWIGPNDIETEGTVVHRDGTPLNDSFVIWYDLVNLPNNGSRDCVSLAGRFTFRTQGQLPADLWGYESCSNTRYIVCSKN